MSEKANFKVDPRLASLLGETYRSLLMTEYGREEDVRISVNGVPLGLDDLPGEKFQADG